MVNKIERLTGSSATVADPIRLVRMVNEIARLPFVPRVALKSASPSGRAGWGRGEEWRSGGASSPICFTIVTSTMGSRIPCGRSTLAPPCRCCSASKNWGGCELRTCCRNDVVRTNARIRLGVVVKICVGLHSMVIAFASTDARWMGSGLVENGSRPRHRGPLTPALSPEYWGEGGKSHGHWLDWTSDKICGTNSRTARARWLRTALTAGLSSPNVWWHSTISNSGS